MKTKKITISKERAVAAQMIFPRHDFTTHLTQLVRAGQRVAVL